MAGKKFLCACAAALILGALPAFCAEAIKIGGYFNSGQDCTASSRVLVDERIYDEVVSRTVDAVVVSTNDA